MIPKNRIELYDISDTLKYTLDAEAMSIHTRDVLTSDIGTFNFSLPTVKGVPPYLYGDVDVNWKAKIYLGYDAISASDLIMTGKIQKIGAPLSKDQGYVRVFEGKSLGEILERRFKTNKCWVSIDAHDIVVDIANDLSLGTGEIAADATDETITVQTESYFDLLKRVSDYWASAGVQVKKDFYVDVNNNLVWKTRPIRTAGVETLTVGTNIASYGVFRDILSVKNKITVYGAPNTTYPADKDGWTEALTNWSATVGTLSLDGVSKKYGAWSICCTPVAGQSTCHFKRTFPSVNIRDINAVKFWRSYSGINATTYQVRLHAPDASNYFTSTIIGSGGNWTWCDLALGPSQEYDANLNPNGIWTKTGTPNWWDIQAIEFYIVNGVVNTPDYIDIMFFSPVRFTYTIEDATSQTNYGIRQAEFTDNMLISDGDCESRAKTLLYQLKDPTIRIDVVTPGNTNLRIGDRLSMTIPAEGISAANYDVVSVEHDLNMGGFMSTAKMVDSANTRVLPPTTMAEAITKHVNMMKEVARDKRFIR
jgi:hypothetical protein